MSVSSNVGAYYQSKCEQYEALLFDILELVERDDVVDPEEIEALGPRIRKRIRKSANNVARLEKLDRKQQA